MNTNIKNYTKMKKSIIYRTFLCAAMLIINVLAYAESVTVNLTREGTLAEKILEQASSLATVTELTVIGPVNSTDWNCIAVQMTSLSILNMKEATTNFSTLSSFNSSISSFIMPEGIKNFSFLIDADNTSLTYIEISNSVDNINSVFSDARQLQTIKFGKGLKSITGRGFAWCSNLTNVYIYDIAAWCNVDFQDEECCPFYEWSSGSSNRKIYINDELVNNLIIPKVEKINNYAFYNCRSIQSIEISEGCKSIGMAAFQNCSNVSNISLPESLTELGSDAFAGCSSLTEVSLSANIHSINSGAFRNCPSLNSIDLPTSLTTIGTSAFSHCTSLTEIFFPESIMSIGSGAFAGCSGLTKVTCLIPFPISASSSIFSGIEQEKCTLVVPEWSALLYRMAIGWSEFSKIETIPTGDLALLTVNDNRYLPESVRPNGTPDVFMSENGSLTVRGSNALNMKELTLNMKIGTSQWQWGYDENGNYIEYCTPNLYGSSLFNDESNLTAQSAKLGLKSNGGTWGFVTLPFDANISEITPMMEGNVNNYVWKTYDGERRALVGTGGNWKEATGMLKAGVGYIYQSQNEDSIYIKAIASSLSKMLGNEDITLPLATYAANDAEDESWNFIGNPYPTYFNTHYIDFTAPITVWNGYGYDAISLTDDDYTLAPCQAFFIQKQKDTETIKFFAEGRTAEASHNYNNSYYYSRHRTAIEDKRDIVNLYLEGDNYKDKSRIVFNEKASMEYELTCDATKFMDEGGNISQIYSLDNKGRQYAINERPEENGCVNIGIIVAEAGQYTISADNNNLSKELFLLDTKENIVTNLSSSVYRFYSDAVTSNSRFVLIFNNDAASINANTVVSSCITITDGGIIVNDSMGQNAEIYTMDGKCIYNKIICNSKEYITLAKGVYIARVGKKSFKAIIK